MHPKKRMSRFTKEVKQKLKTLGKDFECKNEFRVSIGKRWSSLDHVWIKDIPTPRGPKKVVVTAFEITKDIDNLWNTKKMKGDLVNLQLSNASLGVIVIPSMRELKEQASRRKGGNKWLEGIKE